MHSTEDRIRVRVAAFGRLDSLTTWIGFAAVAALAVFSTIAGLTIPGKAAPATDAGATSSTSTSTAPVTSTTTAAVPTRHHRDSSGSVSASSGPPMAVTGSSH